MMVMIKKTMVTKKVNSPYGKAKHGFLNFPVTHPRQATRIPNIPRNKTPYPIPLAPSVNPGIWKVDF